MILCYPQAKSWDMSTEELLRYDREWDAMRRALGAMHLVFAFPQPGCSERPSNGDHACAIPPGLPPEECASTHA